jgi:cell division protein FtsL
MDTTTIQVARMTVLSFIPLEFMISSVRFRKKKIGKLRDTVFLTMLLTLGLGLGIFLVFHNIRIYQKRVELQKRAEVLKDQITSLESRKGELESAIQVGTTQEYQEKILREQGLYKKPGEEVVTILPPAQVQEEQKQQQTSRVWWNPWSWFK